MDLQREPDPQPAPPIATGAVVEKKKVKVIALAAVAIGLVIASFFTWMIRPRTVVDQRPMPTLPSATPQRPTPKLSESAEEAYEKGRREGLGHNPAFNVGETGAGAIAKPASEYKPEVPKRTPEDEYKDLLHNAALADSAVGGEQHERTLAGDGRKVDVQVPTGASTGVPGPKPSPALDAPKNALPAGTFIYCALVNELNGENVGPVKVQASNDVYFPDTFDIAIPQGSIFLGEAQRVSSQFQGRLAVSFDRLQVARGGRLRELKLDKVPGLDQQGATALKDKVDNHYFQVFGTSLAIGAIGGLAQIGNGSYGGYSGYDSETQIRNGISQTMAQNASQILNRFLNRLPTVIIRPGTPVVVYLPFGVELQ